jgi:hypothetical protein
VTLVTIGELTAARVRLYGGTPPVTDKPQGWQVVKPSVIFEVTVNSGVVGGAVTHWVVWPAFLDSVQMMTCVEEDLCTDNMKKLWRDATRATSRIHYTQHQLSSCYMLVRFVEEHQVDSPTGSVTVQLSVRLSVPINVVLGVPPVANAII